jgi:hypothetical protein
MEEWGAVMKDQNPFSLGKISIECMGGVCSFKDNTIVTP